MSDAIRALLRGLSWEEDDLIMNHFGDVVWLKGVYANGKRTHITDCCLVGDPCSHHVEVAKKSAKRGYA